MAEKFVVMIIAELDPNEAAVVVTNNVKLHAILPHRNYDMLAVIPERDFAAAAGLAGLPQIPDSELEKQSNFLRQRNGE